MIRTELLKLRLQRTPQVLAGLLIAAELLMLGVTVGAKDLKATDYLDRLDNGTYIIVAIAAAVLGGFVMGSEYRHDTLKRLAAVGSNRSGILVAKAVVLVGSIVVGSTVAFGIGAGGLSVLASSHHVSLPAGDLFAVWAAGTLWCVALGLVGYAVSLISRSDTMAIVTVVALPLLIDNVIGGIVPAAAKFTMSGALRGVTSVFERNVAQNGDLVLFSPSVAALLLLAWVAVPLTIGSRRFVTRDI
jgi:ABC-type transport system involved in multi-copper enzyme maturation permease subunit